MADEYTIGVYDVRVADYADMVSRASPDNALVSFAQKLPSGSRVLDLGCGVGNASAYLQERGLVTDAWDASAGMVEYAYKAHGIKALQRSFDDLELAEVRQAYDGIWANFSLLHARRAEFPTHLDNIRMGLRAGGWFHIGMKLGEGECRDAIGRHYAYYSEDELREMLGDRGFEVMEATHGEEPGLSGEPAPWVTLLSRLA